jgi:hypothetical protein
MATGTLIAESIRSGSTLVEVRFTVRTLERLDPTNISDEQRAAGIPDTWTLLHFEVADEHAADLADELAAALGPNGWYVDFHTPEESFVVFSRRVFRYRRGDAGGRAAAEEHARSVGVPEAQLDWP